MSDKAKGTAFPLWILAIIIPAGSVVLCCFPCVCLLAFRGGSLPTPAPAKVFNLGDEMRFGDLGVTVSEAGVRGYTSRSPAGHQINHRPEFVITIRFKNYNPNRVINAGAQVDIARLEDDVGNRYQPIIAKTEFGFESQITGQTPRGMARPVRSDDNAMMDVLVFSRPVEGASTLTLTLDASQYGGSGRIQIRIPKGAWGQGGF